MVKTTIYIILDILRALGLVEDRVSLKYTHTDDVTQSNAFFDWLELVRPHFYINSFNGIT